MFPLDNFKTIARRQLRHIAYTLAAAAFAAAPSLASAAGNDACGGESTLAKLQATDPAAHNAIRADAAEIANGGALFWRVEREGVAPSYIYGTVHTQEGAAGPLFDRAREEARNARISYVELTPDEQNDMQAAMQADPAMLIDVTGATIEDYVPAELLPTAKEALTAYGVPYEAGKRLQPWFLNMLFALPPCLVAATRAAPEAVADNALAAAAAAGSGALRSLESWEEQIGVFRDASPEDAKAGFVLTLKTADAAEDDYRVMADAYAAGEPSLILAYSRWRLSQYGDEGATATAWMQAELIDQRNALMFQRSRNEVAKGGVFIAVGALHLVGETGLVNVYRREGYDVTALD